MPELDNHSFQDTSHTSDEPPRNDSRRPMLWALAAVAAIVLGVLLWLAFRTRTPESETASAPPTVPQTAQDAELTRTPENLPSLDGSDDLVRTLVRTLSSRPELATWLANDDLIRGFVAMVDNIARGASPRAFLADFAPRQPFRGSGSGAKLRADPRSFARYNAIADAFASLDSVGVARAYQQISPLCEAAYRDLGVEGTFRRALERAIGRLLATPDVAADAPLAWNLVTYQYTDERIESLPAAEKHLLRLGPRNVGIVKEKLKELTIAMRLVPEAPK